MGCACYVCIVELNEAPATPDLATALFGVMQQVKQAQHDDPVDKSAIIMLARLREHDTLRLSDLAGHLCLDVSTVSRHARTLEDRGYVARADDPADGQGRAAHPDRVGARRAGDRLPQPAGLAGPRPAASWSAAERDDLARKLAKLAYALGSDRPVAVAGSTSAAAPTRPACWPSSAGTTRTSRA